MLFDLYSLYKQIRKWSFMSKTSIYSTCKNGTYRLTGMTGSGSSRKYCLIRLHASCMVRSPKLRVMASESLSKNVLILCTCALLPEIRYTPYNDAWLAISYTLFVLIYTSSSMPNSSIKLMHFVTMSGIGFLSRSSGTPNTCKGIIILHVSSSYDKFTHPCSS